MVAAALLPQRVGSVTDECGKVTNVADAVAIGSQTHSVQNSFPFPVSVAAILNFGSRRRRAVSTVSYPSRAWPKIWG